MTDGERVLQPILSASPRTATVTNTTRTLHFAFAIIAVIGAVLMRWSLNPLLGPTTVPFITFFPAVIVVAYVGGFWPGIVAVIAGAVTACFFFIAPPFSFAPSQPADIASLVVFVLSGIGIALVGEAQRRATLRARRERELLETTLHSIGDGVLVTDTTGAITFLNPMAEQLTGWKEAAATGRPHTDVFQITNEETGARVESPVVRVLRDGVTVGLANHTVLTDKNGNVYSIDDSGAPVRDVDGNLLGTVLVFRDITERRRVEAERERYLTEVQALNERLRQAMSETHHRVKNNLQVITALISLHLVEEKPTIPTTELHRLNTHIQALATIHDILTGQAKEDGHQDHLSIRTTLERLAPMLQRMMQGRTLYLQVDEAILPVRQGTTLAVLVNELVSNAIKHGAGDITVVFTVQEDSATLRVLDGGDGFPPDFEPKTAAHTGLDLIDNLVRWDLQSVPLFINRPEGGAEVCITFALRPL